MCTKWFPQIADTRVLATLAGGHANRSWDKQLRQFVRPAVLFLDDFGMRELTTAQADDLYELISERTGRGGLDDLDFEPRRWTVSTIPESRCCRVTFESTHQHQPPRLYERAILPTQQTARRTAAPPAAAARQS